jgi:hypothetical protein
VYGPNVVTCPAPPDLDPLGAGEGIVFVDETGESLFHVAFGKNLSGPEETSGAVQVGLIDDLESERAPRKLTRKGSSAKSFADAVAGLKPTTRAASRREGNTDNNWADFAIWTKPNTHDFAVTAEPVSGSVGDIVEIPYTVGLAAGKPDPTSGTHLPVPCGMSRETGLRSDLAGWAGYGYCASHSRLFWGLRLHLVTTVHGLPVAFALTNAKADEREVLVDLVTLQPNMFHHPDGLILVVDKGYRDRNTETWLNDSDITVVRPAYSTEPARDGRSLLRAVRQRIESVNQTFKRPTRP